MTYQCDVHVRAQLSPTSDCSMVLAFSIERLGMLTVETSIRLRESDMYASLPVGAEMSGSMLLWTLERGRICSIPFTLTREPDGERCYVAITES